METGYSTEFSSADPERVSPNRKLGGIQRPPILLVILFWHHVVFSTIAIWCAIGLVVLPNSRSMLSGIMTMVVVQVVASLSGLLGAYNKNMKFIYYFCVSQVLLAAMELFWAITCVFNTMLLMFFVLSLFGLYQIFLSVFAYRYEIKECEWIILNIIWPFSIGTHPNHLPSVAEKMNDQLSDWPFTLYGTISETKAVKNTDGETNNLISSQQSIGTHASSAESCAKKPITEEQVVMQQAVEQVVSLKSMHPINSDVSTTNSSVKSTTLTPLEQRTSPKKLSPQDKKKTANGTVSKLKTSIEQTSLLTAIDSSVDKSSSSLLSNTKENTINKAEPETMKLASTSIMERIFGLKTPSTLEQTGNIKKSITDQLEQSSKKADLSPPNRLAKDRRYYNKQENQLPMSSSISVEESKGGKNRKKRGKDVKVTEASK